MYIEQAWRGDNSWWKVMLTTMLCGGIFFIGIIAFFLLPDEFFEQAYAATSGPASLPKLLFTLLPFSFLLALLFVMVRFLHERSILSLTTSRTRFDIKRFLFAFLLVLVVSLASFAIEYNSDASDIIYVFNPPRFFLFFFVSFLPLLFQIGFEEYFFRGFLTQQLGVFSGWKWVPLISTSIIFGVCHAANPEIKEMGMGLLAYYIGTGLFLAIIVQMDEGLELSLGYHFANNLLASALISYEHAALQTETIFKYASDPNPAEMLDSMLIGMAVSYPVLLLVLARVYKWSDWKQRLFGKVTRVESEEETIHHDNHISKTRPS